MLQLIDYTRLTVQSAVEQWQSVLDRSAIDPGRRQPNFTPVETLLCFGLGLIGHANSAGKVNIRESDPTAVKLAALVKRSPGSLALKLANLDGRRQNAAKYEQELWIALTSDLPLFEHLYEVIMTAGRRLGLSNELLPDFLGWESNTLQSFLDADRVSNEELYASIESDIVRVHEISPRDVARETERAMLGTARIGQKQFARSVLENCEFVCVFCGLGFRSAGLPSSRMLVASHIKSWRFSANAERVDPLNGLAACPTHDAAFDSFLLTIGPTLNIVPSLVLAAAIRSDPLVARNFGGGGLATDLVLSARALSPKSEYLEWHRRASEATHQIQSQP